MRMSLRVSTCLLVPSRSYGESTPTVQAGCHCPPSDGAYRLPYSMHGTASSVYLGSTLEPEQRPLPAPLTSCCAVRQFGEVRQTSAMPDPVDLTADSPTGAVEIETNL